MRPSIFAVARYICNCAPVSISVNVSYIDRLAKAQSGEKSFAEILEFFKAHDYILSTNTLRATMGQYKEKNVIAAGHKNGFYKLTEDAQKQYEISEGGF